MKVIAEFTVIPVGVGVSLSEYVAACERVLAKTGLHFDLHANGTNVEGEWDEVMDAVKRCHETLHEMGVPRIATLLKLGTRIDRDQKMDEKVVSVKVKLNQEQRPMAYNLKLAERIKAEMKDLPFVEKKMFGGAGYLLHGNMAVGVNKDDLIVRVAPEKHADLLKRPHVKPFDLTGKPMKGWLIVEAEGVKSAAQLGKWVKEGVEFALALSPK